MVFFCRSNRRSLPFVSRASVAVTAITCMLAVSAAGCTGKDPYAPGETLGTWHVTAALVSTTCGPTPNPWEFDVRLRHEDKTLYWVQGGAPISGIVDPTARAGLKAKDVRTVRDANTKTKTAACTMSREDVLDLVLAPVASPAVDVTTATSFRGTLKYRFAAADGAACDDQLTEAGGDFAALPCEVSYEIGAQRSPAK